MSTIDTDHLTPIEAMTGGVDPHWRDISATIASNDDLLIDDRLVG